MTVKQTIIDYIAAHPGCTLRELVADTGLNSTTVSSYTGMESGRGLRSEAVPGALARRWYINDEPTARPAAPVQPQPVVARPKHAPLEAAVQQLADAITESIMQNILARIERRIADAIGASAARLTPQPEPEAPAGVVPIFDDEPCADTSAATPGRSKPTVVIVGLMNGQQEIIRREFGRDIDLRFWKDKSISQLVDTVSHADFVITTKFTSPAASNAVMAHVPKDRYQHLTGGLNGLRTVLTAVYVKYKEAA